MQPQNEKLQTAFCAKFTPGEKILFKLMKSRFFQLFQVEVKNSFAEKQKFIWFQEITLLSAFLK